MLACNSPSSSGKTAQGPVASDARTTTAPPAPPIEPVPADPREQPLAHVVKELLETQHLRHRSLDDDVSRQAFGKYIERLDGGKMFLLANHVAELEVYADRIDDEMRSGDLTLARVGAARIADRRQVVAKTIDRLLAQPFDFSVDESIETDPDKMGYAKTEAELEDRWRKLLKLQVLQRIDQFEVLAKAGAVKDVPKTFEAQEAKARADMDKMYDGRFSRLAKPEPLEADEAYLSAITAVYDPHTMYMAPIQKENFDIQMSGSLEGIGAVLQEDDHFIRVQEVVPGGAAWRQGDLAAGDLILSVAQAGEDPVDVADMRINQAVQMIRGPKGTVVTLTVKKPDDSVKVISITRDVVQIDAAYARGALLHLGEGHAPMGYIFLPSFYGNTRRVRGGTPERTAAEDVEALLNEFTKRKVSGVILDLRSNGGGLLDQARDIAGLFIETGPVVQARFPDGETQVLEDKDPRIQFDGEVIVMVDRFSASASEIVAGALQDYRRAAVVGTPTHGKGTVQMLVDLDRVARNTGAPLGVLKLTIQQFFLVDGESTQWRGVEPDVFLPDPYAHIESGERYLDRAIPWSAIEELAHRDWPAQWTAAALTAASAKRYADRPVFKRIEAWGNVLDAQRKDTVVPLKLATYQTKRDADKKAREAADPKLDEGKPRFEVSHVSYRGEKPEPPPRKRKGAKAEDEAPKSRIDQWREGLARDPWLEETLYIVEDMVTARSAAATAATGGAAPAPSK